MTLVNILLFSYRLGYLDSVVRTRTYKNVNVLVVHQEDILDE